MTVTVEDLVGLGGHLRRAGLAPSPARTLTFCRAVVALGPADPAALYWAGRLAFVADPAEVAAYDRAFAAWRNARGATPPELEHYEPPAHGPEADPADPGPSPAGSGGDRTPASTGPAEPGAVTALRGRDARHDHSTGSPGGVAGVAGVAETLRRRDFESLSPAERDAVAAAIRDLAVTLPTRRSRRRRAAHRGRRLDVARTLRRAVSTDGEPLRRAWRAPQPVERPLVLLLDVSGSMAAYARPLLQFAFAAHAAGRRVEVFCFATRLTRITPALSGRDPDRALARAAAAVADWDGGTRIAAALGALLRRHSQSCLLRGAVAVICSDGLERDDPASVGERAARLHRLVHRLVWVNPLKRHPDYEPLARGMAAALPHVDCFLPGHNLAALEELARVLATA